MQRNTELSTDKNINSTAKILKLVQDNTSINENKPYELNVHDINIERKVGLGGFAKVYKAKWQKKDVAVKAITFYTETPDLPNLSALVTANKLYMQTTLAEIEVYKVLAPLKSPYIVTFYGYARGEVLSKHLEKPYMLVMEYMEKGDLTAYLKNDSLDWPTKLNLMKGITKAVAFLHEQKIIHGDIKDRNILLDDNMQPKIIDFGLAGENSPTLGTHIFASPEALSRQPRTFASDIFSLAMLFYAMATYADRPVDQVAYSKEIHAGFRPTIPSNCPLKIAEVIDNCWRHDPKQRLTAEEVLIALNAISNDDLTVTIGKKPDFQLKWKMDKNSSVSTFINNKPTKSEAPKDQPSVLAYCFV